MTNFSEKINNLKKDISGHFSRNQEKYLKTLSILFILTSSAFILWALTKIIINIVKNRNNLALMPYFVAMAFIVLFLSSSFLFYKSFDLKNKVNLNEMNANNANQKLKESYENNKYLKIKKLSQIRWMSRILILISGIGGFIAFKMGSGSSKFKDALLPVLFIFLFCLIFISLNNFLSWKIENDLEKFDKEISESIKLINDPNKDNFKIFNQLMLERDSLTKSIYANNFEDSINENDSAKSFLKKILLIFADSLNSLSDAIKKLIGEEKKYADQKINQNLEIFNSKGSNLILSDSDKTSIKDLNKDNKLLKQDGIHNSFFKIIDSLQIQENFYKVF
jgi:hypothetical protein